MRWLAVVALVVVSGAAVRALLQPPAPQVVRTEPTQRDEDTGIVRGKLVYERYGCTMCHGVDGKGGFANPNSETDGKVPAVIYVKEGYTAAEVAKVIQDGKPRIGRGDPGGPAPPYRMPGWHDRMSARETDDLVQYLMSLYPQSATEKWR